MGWLPLPDRDAPCSHPGRPLPRTQDDGRVWQCDRCGTRWAVQVEYYPPWDVNPGELPFDVRWRQMS